MNEQKLIDLALSLGAYQAAVIPVSRIHFDKSFRSLCESNACGNFGMCWMCPPDVGDIVKLIEDLSKRLGISNRGRACGRL